MKSSRSRSSSWAAPLAQTQRARTEGFPTLLGARRPCIDASPGLREGLGAHFEHDRHGALVAKRRPRSASTTTCSYMQERMREHNVDRACSRRPRGPSPPCGTKCGARGRRRPVGETPGQTTPVEGELDRAEELAGPIYGQFTKGRGRDPVCCMSTLYLHAPVEFVSLGSPSQRADDAFATGRRSRTSAPLAMRAPRRHANPSGLLGRCNGTSLMALMARSWIRALHAPEFVQILAAVVRVDDAADLLFELGPPGDVSFSRLSTIMLCAVRHRAVTYIVVASPNQQRPPMPFCRPRHITIPVLDQAASRPRVRSGPLAT